MNVEDIYQSILQQLQSHALRSAYKQDADERDPRYKSYGVRIPQVRGIIKNHKKEVLLLSNEDRLEFAQKLIFSDMGEEQTIAFFVLESMTSYFTPDKFQLIDEFISHLFGWSKIDGFTGGFLQRILENILNKLSHWSRNGIHRITFGRNGQV